MGHRNAPTTAPDGSYGIPKGAAFAVQCQTIGQPAGPYENTLYFLTQYGNETPTYVPDTYTDSPHLAGQPPIAGIPMCGAGSPPPTSSPADAAIAWAQGKVGGNVYQGLCLAFVFDAWSAAGVNLRPWVNVPIGNDTYPVDIWGHFTHGSTGAGTPPAGALVFYASRTGDRTLSHVTLSVGGGNTISSADSLGTPIHYETIAQHNYANYLGWWMPT